MCKCCLGWPWGFRSWGQAGQAFHKDVYNESWNVVIAYGNCNHGVNDDKPSDFPWSPNHYCLGT